jgi:hypothetical protein
MEMYTLINPVADASLRRVKDSGETVGGKVRKGGLLISLGFTRYLHHEDMS